MKNRDVNLGEMGGQVNWPHGYCTRELVLVSEADVVRSEAPAVIARVEMVLEGEDTPHYRIVNTGVPIFISCY